MREVEELQDLGDDLEPSFDLAAFARAFHAGEDVRRLRRLLTRLVRWQDASPDLGPGPRSVTRLLESPEGEIDLARGALLIAQEDEPGLDVGRALGRVEALARELRERLARTSPEPSARLLAVNRFLFLDKGFAAESAQDPARRLEILHLARVLDRRRGHCLGLSVLYLALGARAGLPVFGVSCPGHFFVRWDDGAGNRLNVETTLEGERFADEWYVVKYRLTRTQLDRGLFLGNLAKREVLVEVLNNRANCYWDLGDAARAARDLDRVARVSRNFAPGLAGRGFLALQRGDLGTAIDQLRRAAEIDPSWTRLYVQLGDALLRAGRVPEAATELARAVELDPTSALAHTNLGRVHARRGDVDAAIAAHLRAVELDPRCHVAWNNLGVVRRAAGDERDARAAFKKALAIAPRFLPALENLALVERGAGRRVRGALAVRAALRAYESRVARAPENAHVHAAFARFLVEVNGDLKRAHGLAERACALAPDSPRAWEVFALVVRREGDHARAVKLLERAVALAPARAGADQGRLKSLLESARLARQRLEP